MEGGGLIVEILGQGSSDDQLNAWVATYDNLPIVVRDAAGQEGQALAALTIRETLVILQVPSMEIVYLARGDTTGQATASALAGLTELERLLGISASR